MSCGCTCAVGWLNSALSPVVYGDIALSINTQYNTIQYSKRFHSTIRNHFPLMLTGLIDSAVMSKECCVTGY